jgi:hypothetical protein
MALTSTKGKASDANTIQATSDNIEAVGDEISVHIGPRKARPNLDSLATFADGDVIEPGHRDVHTCGGRKAWVGGVSTTFHRKWDAIFGYLLKLYLLAYTTVSTTVCIGRGTKFTIKETSAGVPGSTVHTGTCELELAQ